ncbi:MULTISPECIES: hypothetical protein [unclassified Gilliamella]|uniref:hypothetical protein n=1 Tax=unclassified Gilliamella TaxID=2685620 RepID=UPI00130C8B6E|nr:MULTISPECIES: hypothetical protein [unclassified Gilliamella]MWP50275.1 hypothetical protein [Gilliamella sp. Lep-s35]MWP69621.1 hypothetical protein [Gilliamella sp. Lep-s5]MWP77888.1 hypothetical protein [Gilliamella sp. Lep-s21]
MSLKKMNDKTRQKFDINFKKIEYLIEHISELKQNEVLELSKLINLESVSEFTSYRKEHYATSIFLHKIINISKEYKNNAMILRNIISAVGFICTRYSFYDDLGFNFIVYNIKNENNIVRMAIVKNIYKFPQFKEWDYKWNYLLSVPQISPKNESIEYFYRAISLCIDIVPENMKEQIIKIFYGYLEKNNINDYQKKDYLSLIKSISE